MAPYGVPVNRLKRPQKHHVDFKLLHLLSECSGETKDIQFPSQQGLKAHGLARPRHPWHGLQGSSCPKNSQHSFAYHLLSLEHYHSPPWQLPPSLLFKDDVIKFQLVTVSAQLALVNQLCHSQGRGWLAPADFMLTKLASETLFG